MLELLSENSEGEGWEDPERWAKAFCTTPGHIMRMLDLPEQALNQAEHLRQPAIQTRLVEVHSLLNRVRPWFRSDLACWTWFISEPLPSFGRLPALEVVKQYPEKGIEALHDFITARDMGGFE